MGYGCPSGTVVNLDGTTVCDGNANPLDHSLLIHTPQLNYAELVYGTLAQDGSSTPNTVGNAIAVDPTRATIIGGSTNVSNSPVNKECLTIPNVCNFATSNTLQSTEAGGTDGWAAVLFFNDILTDAASQSTANPWLQPSTPTLTPATVGGLTDTTSCGTGGIYSGLCSYIQTTPAPFGPTFDFAISDPTTQTQTFQVLFTGQAAGQQLGTTAWWVPLDIRAGANPPVFDNNLPGSGIAYYVPCINPATTTQTSFTFSPNGAASQGYYNNQYPAPGTPYGPMTCVFPSNHLYEGLPLLFSGYPGLTTTNGTLTTPGWLVVSQDINPGVVRLQLDRRAAAGLLEGTYVAQFLVTTYDSQAGLASHPLQWPPCGPLSALNPYTIPTTAGFTTTTTPCAVASTQLPADNASVLVTVRLVVRPTLFLSRNAGILTGITSSLSVDPLYGPTATLSTQDGTGRVPNWLYTGNPALPQLNDTATYLGTATSLNTLYQGVAGAIGVTNVNDGPSSFVCVPGGNVAVSPFPTNNNEVDSVGFGAPWSAAFYPATTSIPCPITALDPAPYTGAISAAVAYTGNGPGDGTTGPGPGPNMTMLYDVGTIQSPQISAQQGLDPTRPDQPAYAGSNFNADYQGGADPITQRNDATIHKYYTTAEGAATISVAAINCTAGSQGSNIFNSAGALNANVGNWLAVQIGNIAPNGTSPYTPICTNLTAANIGSAVYTTGQTGVTAAKVTAPATFCKSGCTFGSTSNFVSDDTSMELGSYPLSGTINGQQVALDFLAKAFSDRPQYNGIPTGLYTAQVFVWSTRAKNTVPGYCLGANMLVSPTGGDIGPCDSLLAADGNPATGNSANPNPLVDVQNIQTFNVTLFVFDTTQIIQITPNACPTNGIVPGQTIPLTATVANSENLDTGNIVPPFGSGSTPNYPNFGPNADGTVVWSLVPWTPTTPGLLNCALPAGGASNGLGTINNTGPLSETSFTAAASFVNTNPSGVVTFYACRSVVAPAWLGSSSFTEDPTKYPPYPSSFQGVVAPVPSLASQTCALSGTSSTGTTTLDMVGTRVGVLRMASSPPSFNFNVSGNGIGPSPATGSTDPIIQFTVPGGFVTGDIPVVGDWKVTSTGIGTSHFRPGWFRPSTGTWWLAGSDSSTAFNTANGDISYTGFGQTGDVPVVGDWAGLGASCIGVVRSGFLWIEDLNCSGVYQPTVDAVFAFGSPGTATIPADVPVVGNWSGKINTATGRSISQAGGVREFANGSGVPITGPALWIVDTGIGGTVNGNVTGSGAAVVCPALPATQPAGCTSPAAQSTHGPSSNPIAFGGSVGDVPVTGDWYNIGVTQFGDFAQGFLWVLDEAVPAAPQASHVPGFAFPYGGLPGDKPLTGKW